MVTHVTGIGILISHLQENAQVRGTNSVIGDSLIEEYRMLQMNFNMMHRTPSPIFRNKFKFHPAGTSIFTSLLDLADQIPLLMVEMDKLRAERNPNIPKCAQELRRISGTLLDLHSRLASWSNILHGKVLEASYGSAIANGDELLDPASITSFELASTWMFSCSYDCYAIETSIEALEFVSDIEKRSGEYESSFRHQQQRDHLRSRLVSNAGGVIEIMPYFMQPDKGIIGRSIAIWPLEGAWSTLESEAKRIDADMDERGPVKVELDVKMKLQKRRLVVTKYLKMCKAVEQQAKSYGLPMFKDRSGT
jgi:hypothetical protein